MTGASGLGAFRISRIVLFYDSSARHLPPRPSSRFLLYMIPGLQQSPRSPNKRPRKIPASPPVTLCFFPTCPPVFRNYPRAGCNQPIFSPHGGHAGSTTPTSRVHARPDGTDTCPCQILCFFDTARICIYDGWKERLERIDDTKWISQKKYRRGRPRPSTDSGGCIGGVVAEVGGRRWWCVAGFTSCPSSRWEAVGEPGPVGDAHRDFTRAGRGWNSGPGQ